MRGDRRGMMLFHCAFHGLTGGHSRTEQLESWQAEEYLPRSVTGTAVADQMAATRSTSPSAIASISSTADGSMKSRH